MSEILIRIGILMTALGATPFLAWILVFGRAAFFAVPFYFMWNYIAPIYCAWLPKVYQQIPFWDGVWIFMLIAILNEAVIPKLVKVSSKSSVGIGKKFKREVSAWRNQFPDQQYLDESDSIEPKP